MSQQQWDRKAQQLKKELLSFLRARQKSQMKAPSDLTAKINNIKKWQNKLEKNLGFLYSISARQHLLPLQEKTLLHWARDFAVKSSQHYREYITAINTLLWAKLVEMRSISVTFDAESDFVSPSSPSERIKVYLRQIHTATTQMEKYLRSLQAKKATLRQRYESLVIAHTNGEAPKQLHPQAAHLAEAAHHLLSLQNRLSRQGGQQATKLHRHLCLESEKLATLASSRTPPPGSTSADAERGQEWPDVDELLRKFDYMDLDASLPQVDAQARAANLFNW